MYDISFSIIIPTYNRPEKLRQCLQSLTRLNYPAEAFEVIVVDDGSVQPLDEVVQSVDIKVRLLRQRNQGPAAARNYGAQSAIGDYLAFTDDDCMPHADWLSYFAAQFRLTPDRLLGGYTENMLTDNIYATASQMIIDYLYGEQPDFFTTNNLAVSRKAFEAIGGYSRDFPLAAGEDREFSWRWQHQGAGLVYVPQARVLHAHNLTLTRFWRQNVNYGRGAYELRRQIKRKGISLPRASRLRFYADLLRYPLHNTPSPHSAVRVTSLFFLSQIAIVTGLLQENVIMRNKGLGRFTILKKP